VLTRCEGQCGSGTAVTIDAFDCEIIAWTAVAKAGISGSDVRDMMLEAVEKRFAATRAPHGIEHLSDNGSAYTARETKLFPGAQSDALLHAGGQSAVERHVGGIRQDPKTGLYPRLSTTGRRNSAPAHRRMNRGL
jgi:hypothetical protein